MVSYRDQVDCSYFGLSKAFDRVHHELLQRKLELYGTCPELRKWVISYLSLRENYVGIHDALSQPLNTTSTVPQLGVGIGSATVFCCFVLASYFVYCVNFRKVILFADDVKLFSRIKSHLDCKNLHSNIFSVTLWCTKTVWVEIHISSWLRCQDRRRPFSFRTSFGWRSYFPCGRHHRFRCTHWLSQQFQTTHYVNSQRRF